MVIGVSMTKKQKNRIIKCAYCKYDRAIIIDEDGRKKVYCISHQGEYFLKEHHQLCKAVGN